MEIMNGLMFTDLDSFVKRLITAKISNVDLEMTKVHSCLKRQFILIRLISDV